MSLIRKRGRSNCEEECCAPLSKRINNLQINPGTCCNGLRHSKQSNSNESGLNLSPEQWAESGPSSGGLHPEMTDNNNVLNFMPNNIANDRLEAPQQYLGNNGDINASPLNLSAAWLANQGAPQYNPDLDASGNPYYYDNNKLLYELYIERLQRCGLV